MRYYYGEDIKRAESIRSQISRLLSGLQVESQRQREDTVNTPDRPGQIDIWVPATAIKRLMDSAGKQSKD